MHVRNAQVRFDIVAVDGETVRVAVPSPPNRCWLTSLATVIGPLARQEARRAMQGPELWAALILSHVMEAIARGLRIDRAVYPEHSLLSTSLYRHTPERLIEIAGGLARHYRRHAIVVRSLTAPPRGHVVWPFRLVWIIDDVAEAWMPRRDSRRDLNILETLNLLPRHHVTVIDRDRLGQCLALYRALYIDTYSRCNPDYSAESIAGLMQAGTITLHTLETADGAIAAFAAAHDDGETLTLPLVGYDQARPRADGLYRAIMAHMALWAGRHGRKLNLSAGAPHFKRHRGAKPWMEYLLIIDHHLPLWRRLGYRLIARVLRALEPRIVAVAGAKIKGS